MFRFARPSLLFGGSFILVSLIVGSLVYALVQRWSETTSDPAATLATTNQPERLSPSKITLFYLAEDGLGLVGLERDVPSGQDTLTLARTIAEHQLAAPPTSLMSPFPEGSQLRAIYLAADGNAFVDLSREVTTAHSGGSLEELFTIYALVNALTTNVPEINAVQILVEGQEVDTLAGHIDLRQPLEPNLKWVVEQATKDQASANG